MTHDELLAEIDYLQVEGTWDISTDSPRFDLVAKNYRALRAVVELEEHIFIGNFVDLHGKNEIYQLGIKDYKESVRKAIERELK